MGEAEADAVFLGQNDSGGIEIVFGEHEAIEIGRTLQPHRSAADEDLIPGLHADAAGRYW